MKEIYKITQKLLFIVLLMSSISYATTYGPPLVKGCSSCAGFIIKKVLTSGNTFGAKRWTDGKMSAPMLPKMSKIVKCPHCNALLWIDEEETIVRGKKAVLLVMRDYNAKPYLELEFEDYFQALKQTNLTLDKEIYLRLHAWWKGNDKRRKKEGNMTQIEKDNIIELYELLSIKDHRIMMAEIQRELGQYDKAMEIINSSLPQKKQSKAEQFIKNLIQQKKPFVTEMIFDKKN